MIARLSLDRIARAVFPLEIENPVAIPLWLTVAPLAGFLRLASFKPMISED